MKSIKLQPIALNKQGRGEGLLFLQTRGLPAPAMGDRARIILERLAAASKPFGTTLEVKGEFGSTIGEIKLGTRNAGR